MLFYRVETPEGNGCYTGLDNRHDIIYYLEQHGNFNFSAYMDARPSPYDDLPNFYEIKRKCMAENSDLIFGFESFDAVFEWFSTPMELRFLKKYDYQVSVYEVLNPDSPYCIKTAHQMTCEKKNLKLVEFYLF